MRLKYIVCYCLFVPFIFIKSSRFAIITTFNSSNYDLALFHYKSLLLSLKPDSKTELCLHACRTDHSASESYEQLRELGVNIHTIDNQSTIGVYPRNETYWLNLRCAAQIADKYFMSGLFDFQIFFIGVNFIFFDPFADMFLNKLEYSSNSPLIFCTPTLVKNEIVNTEICTMDMFIIPSNIGTEFYSVINSTLFLPVTAGEALQLAAKSLAQGVIFFKRAENILRTEQFWHNSFSIYEIPMVEFDHVYNGKLANVTEANQRDKYDHSISIIDCYLFLHIEWGTFYNTANVISALFDYYYASSYKLHQLIGCTYLNSQELIQDKNILCPSDKPSLSSFSIDTLDDERNEPLTSNKSKSNSSLNRNQSNVLDYKPKIFDCFLFNDELDLLDLRFKVLHDKVDGFILVESAFTFTGSPKPLHFSQNVDHFIPYLDKVAHVVIDKLPFDIKKSGDVWKNEYFSRNAIAQGLQYFDSRDEDIILILDIDEIPNERSLDSLRALFTVSKMNLHAHKPRVYKLYFYNFMYDFDCYVGNNTILKGGAGTATSIGQAKKIMHSQPPGSYPMYSFSSNKDENNFITPTRMHLQSTRPYPLQNVLFPAGWHLSFFGGVQKIITKLKSYSHQNFIRQFLDDESDLDELCFKEFHNNSESLKSCRDGLPIYDSSGMEIIPKEIVKNKNISIKKIKDKLSERVGIDNRNFHICKEISLDDSTNQIKSLWADSHAKFQHLNYRSELKTRGVTIAFVSGYIGDIPVIIPSVEDVSFDWYFITNYGVVEPYLVSMNWKPIILNNIPIYNSDESTDNYYFNSLSSKDMKVHPQKYLPKKYDYIVWFDNKYELHLLNVLEKVVYWNSSMAMTLHPKPAGIHNPIKEMEEALLQDRYVKVKDKMQDYISEQLNNGGFDLEKNGTFMYQTGFIIYNMNHPDTLNIQSEWNRHINLVGIQCQIAFYFVAQIYKHSIEVFARQWNRFRKNVMTI